MGEFTSEHAATILAWIESDATGFAAACTEMRPDDPEGLATEIVDVLSQIGGSEEEANPADPESEGEVA